MKCARAFDGNSAIGIFAPSSPLEPDLLQRGLASIKSRGLSVRCPLDPSARYGRPDLGFGSASPEDRAFAINALLDDGDVGLLLAARGGYSSIHVLPHLDFAKISHARKCLVGFSDLTVLLLNIWHRTQLTSIHGPSLRAFAESDEVPEARASVDYLLALVSDPTLRAAHHCEELRGGAGEGPLIPGNLTILQSMVGTPWDIPFDGGILVLEDVGEPPYRVHRALTQLKLAGKFEKLAGVVFGDFTNCKNLVGPSIDQVQEASVRDFFSTGGFPVLRGIPIGHGSKNLALPVGVRARIEQGVLTVLESPVE